MGFICLCHSASSDDVLTEVIYSSCHVETTSLLTSSPAVKVSPDVLRESSSVKMICETPADVTVKQCHFYRNSEQKNIKVSPSCELDLTVSWLLVVLVFTGIGLFLSGLMGFLCLCHFASSDDVLTEVNYSSCHVETTSLLTSSVCSAKHG
ncbi:hypothetical protein PO909_020242 [Leuciscus waleckii]